MDYVLKTGAGGFDSTPGNLSTRSCCSDLGDGSDTLIDAVGGTRWTHGVLYAGPDRRTARYYAEAIVSCWNAPNMSSITR